MYPKALQEVLQYLEEYPGDSYGLFQYGCVLTEMQKREEAKEVFSKIIYEKLDSQYAARYKMGVIFLIECDIEKAKSYFLENIESSPFDETYSYIELARIEVAEGYTEEGLAILEKAKDQTSPKLIIEKAKILNLLKKPDLAYEQINKYSFDPDNIFTRDAYITKAEIEQNLGMVEEAKDTYQKALKKPKDNIYYKALEKLAKYYYILKDYNQAITLCEQIIKNHDSQVLGDVNILFGDIYKDMGDDEKAKEKYQESTKYRHTHMIDKIGYFKIAQLYLEKNNDEEAEKYFKLIDPKNVRYKNGIQLLGLAIIEFRRKNYKKSKEILNEIDTRYVDDEYKKDYELLKAYLEIDNTKRQSNVSYTAYQIRNYSVTRLINHINERYTSDFAQLRFNMNIDLEELILQVPELLENATVIRNSMSKIYQVEYPNIGTVNGENTDILRIVTLPESQKILTMYPYKAGLLRKNIDKKARTNPSQVQKFCTKYGEKYMIKK